LPIASFARPLALSVVLLMMFFLSPENGHLREILNR
jgi:hypothetical protein